MKKCFLHNKTRISPEQVDTFNFQEVTPNQCGVLSEYTEVVVYENNTEELVILLAKHNNVFYAGYYYVYSTGGGLSGPSVANEKYNYFPPTYQTARGAMIGKLNNLKKQTKQECGIMAAKALINCQLAQLSLF